MEDVAFMESDITFNSNGVELEGRICITDRDTGVVVTHPHPLFGGDMHNPVVVTIADAYAAQGYSTIRFNFRGVGRSQGYFDEGNGEQQDVLAAHAALQKHGIGRIAVAGYSFGAWINARLKADAADIAHMTMVSPPVAMLDFSPLKQLRSLRLVVTGDRDDIAPFRSIQKLLPQWNPSAQLKVIPMLDHFYSGHLDSLRSVLADFLQDHQR
jgi:alpha/beta superfamily hydrolase